jgi:hypothetical protein
MENPVISYRPAQSLDKPPGEPVVVEVVYPQRGSFRISLSPTGRRIHFKLSEVLDMLVVIPFMGGLEAVSWEFSAFGSGTFSSGSPGESPDLVLKQGDYLRVLVAPAKVRGTT